MQNNTVIPSLAALLGTIIGGVIVYISSIHAVETEIRNKQTVDAYAEYLSGVAEITIAERKRKDKTQALEKLIFAKGQIAVYGSADVITAMADFERVGAQIDGHGMGKFLSVIMAIRKHTDNESDTNLDDVGVMLFGLPQCPC